MKIEFDTDSAAFVDTEDEGNFCWEIERILRGICCDVLLGNSSGEAIMDVNGNRIGEWSL